MTSPKPPPQRFKKGQSGNPKGRPKGPNRLTVDMKTMIETALHRAGSDVQKKRRSLKDLEPGVAYLVEQAHERPELFMPLVRQLLPAKIDVDVQVMTNEMTELLSERRNKLAQLRRATHGEVIDAELLEPEALEKIDDVSS